MRVKDREPGGGATAPRRRKKDILSDPNRPRALAVSYQGIPKELLDLPQWTCWRFERDRDRGEWTKIPIDPNTGKRAKINDPDTWTTPERAMDYYQEHEDDVGRTRIDGVMFACTEGDPFT